MREQRICLDHSLLPLSLMIVNILAMSLLIHLMLPVSFFKVPFARSDFNFISSALSSDSFSVRSVLFISWRVFNLTLAIRIPFRGQYLFSLFSRRQIHVRT